MSGPSFTGERLHDGNPLFALDLARHRAAYEVARRHAGNGWVLDLGCGSGYGTALLAGAEARVVGLDRVRPDRSSRGGEACFVLGDLFGIPFTPESFDLVVSFQVIEHFEDATDHVDAIADLLRRDGLALVTTPNVLTSDRVNPYHLHEYEADELALCLGRRFDEVEICGITPTEPLRRELEARSRRIRRIVKLDPLGLRHRLPRPLIEWLFARLALFVRRRSPPAGIDATWRDFPLGSAVGGCLDLMALCRRPR